MLLLFSIGCERDDRTLSEEENVEILTIGPYTQTCQGVAEQDCFLAYNEESQQWELFYENIQGFDFEPGFTYTLRVRLEERDPVPQDAGRYAYYLIEVLNKEEVSQGGPTEFTVAGERLYMDGEINSNTLLLFEDVYAANPGITTLVERHVPGSSDDATMITLGRRVRELGLSTHLLSDSEIYSGGVDLFLAGVHRTMELGAVIGVHAWSDGVKDATEFPRQSPEHEMNRRYIADMLGDDAFYWFTIYAAPADDIHIMTLQEIEEYELLTQPVIIE